MKLRRLTVDGVAAFRSYLEALRSAPTLAVPTTLLMDPVLSKASGSDAPVSPRRFRTRFDIAMYLDKVLTLSGLSAVESDVGLWAWLTLFYFDTVCPAGTGGSRKRLEVWRYIPAVGNFQKYYRHLLLGPFVIYRAHGGDPARISAVLANAPHVTDDLMEQLASRQELATNPAVMATLTKLYYDETQQALRRGARSKGPGSPRRMADYFNQLDLTYDLASMSAERLMAFLPREFDRFRDLTSRD